MSRLDDARTSGATADVATGPWRTFVRDLRWGVRSWATEPSVPIIVAIVFAGVAYSLYIPLIVLWLVSPLRLAAVGFYAVPWAFYLRASEGSTLPWYQMFPIVARYLLRFLRLGLLVLACIVVPLVALYFAFAARAARSGHPLSHVPTWYTVAAVVISFAIDAALTFATPALVYSTDSALEALGSGFRFMRSTWPSSAFYVFTPGITLSLIGLLLPESVAGVGEKVAIAAVGAVIGFAFKGAIAAFYLRGHPNQRDRLPLITSFL